jgi:glycosyltransferase involved in cell wall biosynthesis
LAVNDVCYIADMAHHYREPIFRLMSERFACHFYFGDKPSTVKVISVSDLPGFQRHLHYIKLPWGAHYLSGAVSKALSYKKIILLGDPHGIHNWIICLLGRVLGRDVYLWTHGWYGNESFFKGALKKLLFKLGSRILVYGPRAKNLLISQGFSSDKIKVVFNSLDYDQQVVTRLSNDQQEICRQYFGNSNPVIVYVGRVQKIKRLDLLVKAIHRLKHEGLAVNFVLIGSLDGDDSIRQLVGECGLSDVVWFYGPCYDESELYRVISSSDVCVSPGNVGLTAIHALSYGCPVITHNDFSKQMPEFEAVIPGKTGDFFNYGNVSDLVSKIRFWVYKRKKFRSVVSDDCYSEVSRRWNPHVQIEKICEALEFNNDG